MKKIIFIAALVFGIAAINGFIQKPDTEGMAGTGKLVLQITDAQTELNIEKVEVTISDVEVHLAQPGKAEEYHFSDGFEDGTLDKWTEVKDVEVITDEDKAHNGLNLLGVISAGGYASNKIDFKGSLEVSSTFYYDDGESEVIIETGYQGFGEFGDFIRFESDDEGYLHWLFADQAYNLHKKKSDMIGYTIDSWHELGIEKEGKGLIIYLDGNQILDEPYAMESVDYLYISGTPGADANAVYFDDIELKAIGEQEPAEKGWIPVVDEPQTFDLIEIKDAVELLGEEELPSGKYTQIRLKVKNATVTVDGHDWELPIPSETIKLTHPFTIEPGQTTTLTLDFDAEKSIILIGETYTIKPVITVVEPDDEKAEKIRIDGMSWDTEAQEFILEMSAQSGVVSLPSGNFYLGSTIEIKDFSGNIIGTLTGSSSIKKVAGAVKDENNYIAIEPLEVSWPDGSNFTGDVEVTVNVEIIGPGGTIIDETEYLDKIEITPPEPCEDCPPIPCEDCLED